MPSYDPSWFDVVSELWKYIIQSRLYKGQKISYANKILVNMQEHRTHAHFRKIIAGPYSFSNIKKMEPLIDSRIVQWTDALDTRYAKTNIDFDFGPWAVFMAYDIISEVGFGAPIGFIEKGEDIGGLIQGFHDGLPAFGLMCRLYPFT